MTTSLVLPRSLRMLIVGCALIVCASCTPDRTDATGKVITTIKAGSAPWGVAL